MRPLDKLDPMDTLRAVLQNHDDPPTVYRGKVRVSPFIQGGHYWRTNIPEDALLAQDTKGEAHFAGLQYVEDERGQSKSGYRELRGQLKLWQADGKVWLGRDAERWELVADPRGTT